MRTVPAICVLMLQQAKLSEQVVPIVNHVVAISDREQRKFLRPGVSHVRRNRQELLEHKKQAERDALSLALKESMSQA